MTIDELISELEEAREDLAARPESASRTSRATRSGAPSPA